MKAGVHSVLLNTGITALSAVAGIVFSFVVL